MPPKVPRPPRRQAPPSAEGPGYAAAARRTSDPRLPPGEALLAGEGRVTPSLRLTIYMVLAARRWRSLLDEHLRPIGQSAARMEAMWAIAYVPPRSPQIEIARLIGIEGATMTRMLDSLETDGLIARRADPADRRSKHIQLTAAGALALQQILDIADALRARLLTGVEENELTEANGFIGMLLDRFETGLPLLDEGLPKYT